MQQSEMIGSAMQRVGVLSELPAVLSEMGVSPVASLSGTGISPDNLRPDARVPFGAVLRALDRAAGLAGCPHLGLLVGLRFRMEHHGLIGRLMAAAPTLGRALDDFVAWQPGYSSGAVVYLARQDDRAVLGYGTFAGPDSGSRKLYDGVMAIALRMVEQLTAAQVRPVEVLLPYREPEDAAAYARHLKVPVRFGQPLCCLVLETEALETRLPGGNPERRRDVLAAMSQAMRATLPDTRMRVCHALRPLVPEGRADMAAVAAVLGVHPRTLRRQLAAEGAVFSDLRDQVRFAISREFLEMTDLPVGEISAAAGFSAQGVFAESFRRWSGTTPTDWRRSRRHEQPALPGSERPSNTGQSGLR